MRLIDADILKEAFIVNTDRKGYLRADPEVIINNAPTVTPPDTFTRDELEAWLYANAANNLDGNTRDQLFADDCAEIIKRLDGFERFVKDRREGKI